MKQSEIVGGVYIVCERIGTQIWGEEKQIDVFYFYFYFLCFLGGSSFAATVILNVYFCFPSDLAFDWIAEPDILKEVKQKLDLGSVKFEVWLSFLTSVLVCF